MLWEYLNEMSMVSDKCSAGLNKLGSTLYNIKEASGSQLEHDIDLHCNITYLVHKLRSKPFSQIQSIYVELFYWQKLIK